MNLTIDQDFREAVSQYRAMIVTASIKNGETSSAQIKDIDALCQKISESYKVEDINKIPAIAATRAAYKACGKDPNRYRPSQEQLHRRIVRGLGLYNVNAMVDAGNQLSLLTGCSVGCFDADKIQGNSIHLGIGKKDEPYEGIGRGMLNIEGLPVFRDDAGGFGTPTSDNERTKIDTDTTHLLVTVHIFDSSVDADEVLSLLTGLIEKYCDAKEISSTVYTL